MDVADGTVLHQGGGDEQAVVGRFLHERDDRGEAGGGARELRQARIVEPHRDLAVEVLQQVARQAELREDHEVRALFARIRDPGMVLLEVDIEHAEARRVLGEGDAERLHGAESTPQATAGPRRQAGSRPLRAQQRPKDVCGGNWPRAALGTRREMARPRPTAVARGARGC